VGGQERGASAVEYALLVAGVALGLVLVAAALGTFSRGVFYDQCTRLGGPANEINADIDINATRNC
jgi:Flp pilus assembly pilin Flp